MTDELRRLADHIQNDIFEQAKQELGEGFLDSWLAPQHMGHPGQCSSMASLTGSCGDQIDIYLLIKEERIREARFTTTGCGPSIVCADTACRLAEGKDLEQAGGLEAEDILCEVKRLPKDHAHCAFLAAQTLREAIRIYWQEERA
jgi:nitrogen fixation NifU-like protein